MATFILLSITINAQKIKNAKTETAKVYGNCGMCKTKIEKAGNIKNSVSVDWNKDTGMATITYDTTKTNKDEILQRIALVGVLHHWLTLPLAAFCLWRVKLFKPLHARLLRPKKHSNMVKLLQAH